MTSSSKKRDRDMPKAPTCAMGFDGHETYVEVNGVRIARREKDTPQGRTWVSLEPGYRVLDERGKIVVEHNGVRVQ
jgi:hypothetical protein